jgi:hypothetical protein
MSGSIQNLILGIGLCGISLAPGTGTVAQTKGAQDKPPADKAVIVVETFSASSSVPWPYDMKLLQTETMAELKAKEGQKFNVSAETPAEGSAPFYRLQGEVLEWHPGNRAKRMMVGMGSGREEARIRYWLVSRTGMKVFEHTDVIRAEFWGNAYAGSVGELAHPFADKIAKRLGEAKLE